MKNTNDSYEIHRYVEIVKKAIDESVKELLKNLPEERPQRGPKQNQYDETIKQIDIFSRAKKELKKAENYFYCLAICFSDVGDSLSQWRGYGDDGQGISIGFDESLIQAISDTHDLYKYREVNYYYSENDQLIQEKMNEYLEKLKNIALDRRCNTTAKQTAALWDWAVQLLEEDAPFYKPAGFIEERETRLCYVRIIMPKQMVKPADTSHLQRINFHVSHSAIVPHYELSLCLNDVFLSNIIQQVMIGPSNYSDKRNISQFLAKEGFDEKNIKVDKSKIPYRSRK